jgi:hypothetical protein
MTQCCERSHLEFTSPGEGLHIQSLSLPTAFSVFSSDHVAQKAQGHGLVPALSAIPCVTESMMLTLEPIAYNGQARSGVYLAETFVVTNAVPPARSA